MPPGTTATRSRRRPDDRDNDIIAADPLDPLCELRVADSVFLDGIFVCTGIVATGLFEGHSLRRRVLPNLRAVYLPTLRASVVTSSALMPLQFLSFRFLPVQLRVLSVNAVDLVWTAVVSFVSHGGGGDGGGELVTAEDPLESGIEIVAQPPGTKLKGITLLSGGQKTLTAVALLFALYMVKPSPFCLLDELDAPLDESNIHRFTNLLKQFVKESQFIIITHNKSTIAAADAIYGVTMQERGVSRTLSMKFDQSKGAAEVLPVTIADAVRSAAPSAPAQS